MVADAVEVPGEEPPAGDPARAGRAVRSLRVLSWAYLAALGLLWVVTRGVAERSWATTLLLYAPQVLYGAPLLLLAAGSRFRRDPSALLAQGLAAGVVAGPFMGLCLPAG